MRGSTGSLLHSVLEHGNFWKINISQSKVATCLRRGTIFNNHFIANLLMCLSVKEFSKIGQDLTETPS